jgi:membrane-associated phospholipid phosphatase
VVAARLSDASLVLLAGYPAFDALAIAWGVHGSPDVAWQMLMIDAEAFAFNSALTGVIKRAGGRARPATSACRADPSYDPRCATKTGLRSFYSGHASTAFTSAGLTCLHHSQLGLYGRDGDVLACVSATTLATSVALERVLADRHYATDVLTGAASGLVSGALIPWLSFYRHGAQNDAHHWSIVPKANDQMFGIGVIGRL